MKFDHTKKWYTHNPESVQENETQSVLWDFEIQIDLLFFGQATRPTNSHQIKRKEKNKRTCRIVDFAVQRDQKVKLIEHENDGDIICNLCSRYGHQKLVKWTGGLGNEGRRRDHPNYSLAKICQNTKKIRGDLGRLPATLLVDHQPMLV